MAACLKHVKKFRSLHLMILFDQITSLYVVYTQLSTWWVPSPTLELLPLKVLEYGLQKTTGSSSGVVASILLVSPGLSLAKVCATCLRCQ